jgi:hypothetical protein
MFSYDDNEYIDKKKAENETYRAKRSLQTRLK